MKYAACAWKGSSAILPGMDRPRRRSRPPARPERGAAAAPESAELQPRRPRTRDEEREALLAYAFRALGARASTAAELRSKLARRCEDEELVEDVLRRVQELGYQNDEEVARSEGRRSGVGAFRVRQTLKRRGVSAELIDETLQERDPDTEQEDAARLLERRWPALRRKRDPRASAYAFLARRGFSSGVIWAALREVGETLAAQDGEAPGGAEEEWSEDLDES